MEENEQQVTEQLQAAPQQPIVSDAQPQVAVPAEQELQTAEQPQPAYEQSQEVQQEVQSAEAQPVYEQPQPEQEPQQQSVQETADGQPQETQVYEQQPSEPQQYEQPQVQSAEQPQETQPAEPQPVYEQPAAEQPQPAEAQPIYGQSEQPQPVYAQQPAESAEDFPPLTYEIQQPVNSKPKPKLRKTGAKPVIAPLINSPEGSEKKTRQRTRRSAGARFTPPSGALPIVRSAADITEGTEDGMPTAEENTVTGSRRVTKSRVALFIDIDGTNISRDNLEELFYSITARQQILFAKIYGYGEDKAEFDDIIQKYNVQVAGKLDSKSMYGNRIDPRVLLDAYECASKNKSILDTVFVWCAPCELSYMFERIIKLGVATATIDNPYFDCNNQWTSTKIKLFSPYTPFYDPNYAYNYDQQQYNYDYTQQPEYYEQLAQDSAAGPVPAPEAEQPTSAPVPEPAPEPIPAAPEPMPTPEPAPLYASMPVSEPMVEEQPISMPEKKTDSAPEELTPEQMAEQMPWLIPETPAEVAAMEQMQPPEPQPQPQPNKEDDFEPEPEGVEIHESYGFGSEMDMDAKPPETEEDNRMMVIDMMKEMGMDFGQGGGNDEQSMSEMMGQDSNAGGNLDDI